MKKLLLKGILFYQREISPRRGPCCRFYPTCSEYARIAVERYGALHGSWLAARRLARCTPLNKGVTILYPKNPPKAILGGTKILERFFRIDPQCDTFRCK